MATNVTPKGLLKLKTGTALRVYWRDACASMGWADPSDYSDNALMAVTSVGILVAGSDEHMTLATSEAEDGSVTSVISIPLGWVQRVERLG